MPDTITHAAVLGCGTIGASWAANFLAQGLSVAASDPGPAAETFLRRFVDNAWPTLEALGLAPGADPGRLTFHANPLDAMQGVQFVQESGPERLEVKLAVFEQISRALPPEAIIASSSSTFMPTEMQARCVHPERMLLGHPFNPPHLIPLVEVCGGARTSEDAIQRAMAFYRAIGKHPIRLNKEMPGHVSNRLQSAIWREAAYLVEQGVVSVEDVDAAVAMGPGLRWALMGPILTFHLGGGAGGLANLMEHIDVSKLWPGLGTPAMTPAFRQALVDGVIDEAGGRPIDELARERDRRLLALLKAVAPSGGGRA